MNPDSAVLPHREVSRTEIYYFSGTGNSLAVARDLAGRLGARLIPLASVAEQESINPAADAVGLVFPLYDFKPPSVVERFIRRLGNVGGRYVFAVCTYGIAPSRSLHRLDRALRACGGHLAAGFAVAMPHSGIGGQALSSTEREKLLANWPRRIDGICGCISARTEARIESGFPLRALVRPALVKMLPYLLRYVKQVARKGVQSLAMTAGRDCDGCRVCARICPVGNIDIVAGRPLWQDHCAGCFACLHWCPKKAISLGGLDMGIQACHHPDVGLTDMIRR